MNSRNWIFGALLVVVTFLAYQPAWNGKPVWDDTTNLDIVSKGPAYLWSKPDEIFRHDITRYPVSYLLFRLEYKAWGESTLGYHLLNIALHLIAGFLLLVILRRLAIPGAWLAVFIWVLHPVQVESVAWITEVKNTLATVLSLGFCLAYLQFDRERKRRFYALALALFALGIEAKSSIVPLPAALLAVLWWKRGKLSLKYDIFPMIPFLIAATISGAITVWLERTFYGAQGNGYSFPTLERVLVAGRAFWFYLGKIFWPSDLILIYPLWKPDPAVWWQWLFPTGAAIAGCMVWMLRHRWRAPFAALIYFVVMIFPVLGFFNISYFIFSFVADHWLYQPAMGPIVLASAGLSIAAKKWQPRPVQAFSVIVLIVLSLLTLKQTHLWENFKDMEQAVLRHNSACAFVYDDYGSALLNSNKTDSAIVYFRKAMNLKWGHAYYDYGLAMKKSGKLDEAIANFRIATDLMPATALIYYDLGNALVQAGRSDEAIEPYRMVLRLMPHDAGIHADLACLLLNAGRIDTAVVLLREAIRINPGYFDAYFNLAQALRLQGNSAGALDNYRKALALDSASFLANYNTGALLLEAGRPEEAVGYLERAQKIRPNQAAFEENLGVACIEMGRLDEAISHLKLALQADSGSASLYAILETAYAKKGDRQSAALTARMALDAARKTGDEQTAGQMREELERLRSGK